ncbi:CHAT domain-containing protein [Amycolatopsis sulphurea]|uniref:CHAT domain-containing protein n=1 Tax=Amycolatopsis sulphurea TaxID=76022 RepID=A0A2A9F4I9_9PSEU|nr:CHAT domain-containing protein [Amycolatopsis sulphurea]PFG46297.1 CHAT domain-containing protein [Amycolatopsis sulphurea]
MDTRLGASETSHRLSPAGDPAPEGDVEPAPASHPRHLVAGLPSRAALGTEISLLVRVATDPGPWSASVLLDRLAGATAISLLVQPSTGLVPLGAPEQRLTVPPHGESEPVRFVFRTEQPGLHGVRLMAFAGGTFLAELETQVSVEPGGPAGQPEWARSGPLDVRARRGEVTLQVRSLGGQTVFQLLSDAYLFEPVLAQGAAGDASAAIERAITTLKQLAQGRGPYTGSMARRWMAETGVGLWQAMVPHVLQDQFWQIREHISAFSIATDFDVVPWELLYPLRPGADDGFLVEQFPVLRRVFGQARNAQLAVTPCTYVTSEPAPTDAQEEVDALRRVLGPGASLGDLGALLDLIAAGPRGGLHFACHNTFTPEDGASVAMRGGPFVPGLLNSAAVRQSLAGHRPLVFLNACRTAGNALEFSRMIGWAQQFMAAGAGAFVGTLWPVRSRSARVFAETFYGSLQDGATLGNALGWARRAAVHDDPDPSWLAYTAYGDPEATAFPPA